jgi:hypothetical protein
MLSLVLAALLASAPAPADHPPSKDTTPQEHVDGVLPSGTLFTVIYDETTISKDHAATIGTRLARGVWHTLCESKKRMLCSPDPGHYEISIFLYTDPNYPFGCIMNIMPLVSGTPKGYLDYKGFQCTSKRNFEFRYNEHNEVIMAQ